MDKDLIHRILLLEFSDDDVPDMPDIPDMPDTPDIPQPEDGTMLCLVETECGSLGGYRLDMLTENLSERDRVFLICPSCKGIMKEACTSSNGEQLCNCCAIDTLTTPNVAIRSMVLLLKCSCPLIVRGCDWLGTLGSVENHLDACGYRLETCKLGCGMTKTRNECIVHEKNECAQRKVICEDCHIHIKLCYLSTHKELCPKMNVSCELCGVVIYREEMTRHMEVDCTERAIDCPFVKYKCEMGLIKRKDLSRHLEEKKMEHTELKLNALEDIIVAQSEKILKLSEMEKIILKQNEKIQKHTNTIDALFSISKIHKAAWTTGDLTNELGESEMYNIEGYRFRFQVCDLLLQINFSETQRKYSSPFKTNLNVFLVSAHGQKQIASVLTEIKQRELSRGCEKVITILDWTDILEYSLGIDTGIVLTFEIYLTMLS